MLRCPRCDGDVEAVPRPAMLNSYQWDAIKAGDYYCASGCAGDSRTGFAYFTTREVMSASYCVDPPGQTCSSTGETASPAGVGLFDMTVRAATEGGR